MSHNMERKRKFDYSDIKSTHEQIYKINFFNVQIYCQWIIFPAHRYVLSSRSELFSEQLASGVSKLVWTEFEDRTCTTLLRWIYTNKVVFSQFSTDDASDAEQWLDLLHASYKLQLVSLFKICERTLLLLVNDGTSRRFYDVAGKVGANQLLEKCLELRLNVRAVSPEALESNVPAETVESVSSESVSSEELEIDEINTDYSCSDSASSSDEGHQDDEFEEILQLNKLTIGYHDFRQFSDIEVITGYDNDKWQAHAHVLESRSKKILEEFQQTTQGHRIMYLNGFFGIQHKLLRWLYTDCIVFDEGDNNYAMTSLLKAAEFYELRTLFERCEQAIVGKVDITSSAYFHNIAKDHNSETILKCCNQLISKYFKKLKSPDCSEMDVDPEMELDNSNSLSEMMVSESATEENVEGLLTLNDDCLLHLFRFVSLVDLGSIKDTCKRLSSLADLSFKVYREKSLNIGYFSFFADIWILKHFGKLINTLSLDSCYERYASQDNIFEMIDRYTGEQLKSIAFNGWDKEGEGETFECLKTVMKNVECIKLSLFNYDSNIDALLNCCENLKEVNIDGESMKLNSDWCSKNPNITKLNLFGLQDDEILEEICKKLTRLECLSFDCIEKQTNQIIHLSRLCHLKELKIEAYRFPIHQPLQQFADKTVLKDLTLKSALMTESLANVLGDFPNLSNLVFHNGEDFDDESIQDILSQKLVNIKSLAFKYCYNITFKAIAKIIRNLLDLKKLSVNSCDEIEFIDKDNYLSLRKTRDLQILLNHCTYERTCEVIGSNLLYNVQLIPFDFDDFE